MVFDYCKLLIAELFLFFQLEEKNSFQYDSYEPHSQDYNDDKSLLYEPTISFRDSGSLSTVITVT
jgi:hypothetical protein